MGRTRVDRDAVADGAVQIDIELQIRHHPARRVHLLLVAVVAERRNASRDHGSVPETSQRPFRENLRERRSCIFAWHTTLVSRRAQLVESKSAERRYERAELRIALHRSELLDFAKGVVRGGAE